MVALFGCAWAVIATVVCVGAVVTRRSVLAWMKARRWRKSGDDTVEIVRPGLRKVAVYAALVVLALPAAVYAGSTALPGPSASTPSMLELVTLTLTGQLVHDGAVVDVTTESDGDWTVTPAFSGSDATKGRVVHGTRTKTTILSPLVLSGDVNNYAGCNFYGLCSIDSNGVARNITGVAGGSQGDLLEICAYNAAGALTAVHNSASSSAGNKFFFHDAANRTINPRQCRRFRLMNNGTDNQWWEVN